MPATPLGELVAAHGMQLLAAAQRRHAREVPLFGSVARGEDSGRSDIDFLVTLDPDARPLALLSLACDAEDVVGVRADVGTVASLRPDVRQHALNDAVLLVFDACRARLIEIGDAVEAIDSQLLAPAPENPWREIARMRNHLTHRYFDTQHEIVADVITSDLPALKQAVGRLRHVLADADSDQLTLDVDNPASDG